MLAGAPLPPGPRNGARQAPTEKIEPSKARHAVASAPDPVVAGISEQMPHAQPKQPSGASVCLCLSLSLPLSLLARSTAASRGNGFCAGGTLALLRWEILRALSRGLLDLRAIIHGSPNRLKIGPGLHTPPSAGLCLRSNSLPAAASPAFPLVGAISFLLSTRASRVKSADVTATF